MSENPTLKDAYALDTPQAMEDLYRTWAHSYDMGFGEAQGFQLPREVAQAFVAAGGVGPLLDVGAGTGLVGEQLARLNVTDVDAVDLSAEMLSVAQAKNVYRTLIVADICKPLSHVPKYAGIVSSGTFTMGHVGPEAIPVLLDAAAPGALFVISVNAAHFESAGFSACLDQLCDQIDLLPFKDVRIYDDRADAAHRDDMARLLLFRKRGE